MLGDDLQYALWLRCETWVSAAMDTQKSLSIFYGVVQAGVLVTLFFAWNVGQMFEELEVKRSITFKAGTLTTHVATFMM